LTVAHATPQLIDRGDLLAALDRAAVRKVTIISAPAGSGKTSLLRAWADRQGQWHRLAVLQVQRDQQDAQQFWLALLDAVHHASATTGDAEPPAGPVRPARRSRPLMTSGPAPVRSVMPAR
jgi:LuxR family transcriptional regulator, maltose regulon positive regulatory protein